MKLIVGLRNATGLIVSLSFFKHLTVARPTADSEAPVSLPLTISVNNDKDSSEVHVPPVSQSSSGTILNKRKSRLVNDGCASLVGRPHSPLPPPSDFGGHCPIFENPIGDHWPSTQHGFNFDSNLDSCIIDTLDLNTTDVIVNYYQFDSFRDTTDFYLGKVFSNFLMSLH